MSNGGGDGGILALILGGVGVMGVVAVRAGWVVKAAGALVALLP